MQCGRYTPVVIHVVAEGLDLLCNQMRSDGLVLASTDLHTSRPEVAGEAADPVESNAVQRENCREPEFEIALFVPILFDDRQHGIELPETVVDFSPGSLLGIGDENRGGRLALAISSSVVNRGHDALAFPPAR